VTLELSALNDLCEGGRGLWLDNEVLTGYSPSLGHHGNQGKSRLQLC
jgi:hypothetical protein